MKEFASKERKFEGRMKEQVLKLKHFGRKTLKEHESNERKFKGQVKDLLSKENHFESRKKDLELNEKN
jgi:hypothetical protein